MWPGTSSTTSGLVSEPARPDGLFSMADGSMRALSSPVRGYAGTRAQARCDERNVSIRVGIPAFSARVGAAALGDAPAGARRVVVDGPPGGSTVSAEPAKEPRCAIPSGEKSDAFYIAFGAAALIGVSAALGALVDPLVGVALFVARRDRARSSGRPARKDPDRRRALREAAAQGPGALGPAHARARDRQPHDRCARRCARSCVARGAAGARAAPRRADPLLARALHRLRRRQRAARRARADRRGADLGALRRGSTRRGRVGDPNAALGAIEDELRISGADEVIVSTLPAGESNWLETGIVERLREELDIPVTHLVAEPAPSGAGGAAADRYCATAPSADQAGVTPSWRSRLATSQ